ncbi:MAG: hypothetical protein L0271_20870 [Gemmatimonadetes bacterium]|nr:hypothetical protein [Gemmatimonadota bacterium]
MAPFAATTRSERRPDAAFTPALRRIFRAVTEVVVPEARRLDDSEWLAAEAIVARAIAQRPRRVQRQIRLFMRILDGFALLRRGRRLHAMDAPPRAAFLERIQASRILLLRRGFWGLRTLALMGYYGRPGAAAEIGYRAHAQGWDARAR